MIDKVPLIGKIIQRYRMGKRLEQIELNISDLERAQRDAANREAIAKLVTEEIPYLIDAVEIILYEYDHEPVRPNRLLPGMKRLPELRSLEELDDYDESRFQSAVDNVEVAVRREPGWDMQMIRTLEQLVGSNDASLSRRGLYRNYCDQRQRLYEDLRTDMEANPDQLLRGIKAEEDEIEALKQYMQSNADHLAETILLNESKLIRPSDRIDSQQFKKLVKHIRAESRISNQFDMIEKKLDAIVECFDTLIGYQSLTQGDLRNFRNHIRGPSLILTNTGDHTAGANTS